MTGRKVYLSIILCTMMILCISLFIKTYTSTDEAPGVSNLIIANLSISEGVKEL